MKLPQNCRKLKLRGHHRGAQTPPENSNETSCSLPKTPPFINCWELPVKSHVPEEWGFCYLVTKGKEKRTANSNSPLFLATTDTNKSHYSCCVGFLYCRIRGLTFSFTRCFSVRTTCNKRVRFLSMHHLSCLPSFSHKSVVPILVTNRS